MEKNFWEKLKKPILALAPMADVTDCAFRNVISKYGKPDIMWTEFVSVEGLCSSGKERLLIDLKYSDSERPIVAQIFGADPDKFFKVAGLCKELGFDGIDINMGCPDKSINKQKAGADLINNPKLAKEIVLATKEGALGLPVSIKTRIGYNKPDVDGWIGALLETKPVAVIVHGRTKKEMSKVPAHWDQIARASELAKGTGVLVLGNGDVKSLKDAYAKTEQFGVDGVMIGRGIFGNPWLFSEYNRKCAIGDCGKFHDENRFCDFRETISLKERLTVLLEHTKLFEQEFSGIKSFAVMKKHFKAYVEGFDGAKDLRMKLMESENSKEVEDILKIQGFI